MTAEAKGWCTGWLDSVADGTFTMSQRKLTSIEAKGGGLDVVREIARRRAYIWCCVRTTMETSWLRPASSRLKFCARAKGLAEVASPFLSLGQVIHALRG